MRPYFINRTDYNALPDRLQTGLRRYIDQHIETGDFLRAVLENDLQKAIAYADDESVSHLPALVLYIYNCCNSACWGSKEKVEKWLSEKPQRE